MLAHELFDVAAACHLVKGNLLLHDLPGRVDEHFQHVDSLSTWRASFSTRSASVRTTIVNL